MIAKISNNILLAKKDYDMEEWGSDYKYSLRNSYSADNDNFIVIAISYNWVDKRNNKLTRREMFKFTEVVSEKDHPTIYERYVKKV